MRKSHVDEKVLNHKINNTGMGIIFKDMGEERRLEMMSKYNQFEDKRARGSWHRVCFSTAGDF